MVMVLRLNVPLGVTRKIWLASPPLIAIGPRIAIFEFTLIQLLRVMTPPVLKVIRSGIALDPAGHSPPLFGLVAVSVFAAWMASRNEHLPSLLSLTSVRIVTWIGPSARAGRAAGKISAQTIASRAHSAIQRPSARE